MKSTIILILRLLSKELSAISFHSPYANFHIRKKVLLSDLFLGKPLSPQGTICLVLVMCFIFILEAEMLRPIRNALSKQVSVAEAVS